MAGNSLSRVIRESHLYKGQSRILIPMVDQEPAYGWSLRALLMKVIELWLELSILD